MRAVIKVVQVLIVVLFLGNFLIAEDFGSNDSTDNYIFPAQKGNKWWYSGTQYYNYNPEGSTYKDTYMTYEITDVPMNDSCTFIINNDQK
ncbi:MAG: hypothetical protein JXQ65_04975 [Candidatus Marinimicrobia bacterium]|nr:hypothetical protein [Candidatus Neomarinimicrobiota bacterium]